MPSPEQGTVFETSGALGLFEAVFAVTNGDTDFGSRLVVTASEDRDSTRGLNIEVGGLGGGGNLSWATEGDLALGDCGRISLPNSSFPTELFSVLEEVLSCRHEGDASRSLRGGL